VTDLEILLRESLAAAADAVPVSAQPLATYRRRRARGSRRPRLAIGLSIGAVAAVVVLIVVGSLALSGGGPSKPARLANGRSLTLTPSSHVSHDGLSTAARILQQRLVGLGVKGATVKVSGGALRATVPPSAVATVRTTAASAGVLQFRQVLEAAGAARTTPSHTARRSVNEAPTLSRGLLRTVDAWDCTRDHLPATNDIATDYIVACDSQQPSTTTYLLGPAAIDGSQVSGASAGLDSTGQWVVNLTFNATGSTAWQRITAKTYNVDNGKPDVGTSSCAPPAGCNAVAITLDGAVASAPYSETAGGIAGGNTQISGSFSQRQADRLADVLKYGALPTTFRVTTTS
jgi:preprotein translocase subunit SecD